MNLFLFHPPFACCPLVVFCFLLSSWLSFSATFSLLSLSLCLSFSLLVVLFYLSFSSSLFFLLLSFSSPFFHSLLIPFTLPLVVVPLLHFFSYLLICQFANIPLFASTFFLSLLVHIRSRLDTTPASSAVFFSSSFLFLFGISFPPFPAFPAFFDISSAPSGRTRLIQRLHLRTDFKSHTIHLTHHNHTPMQSRS